jgi:hypothetical protein
MRITEVLPLSRVIVLLVVKTPVAVVVIIGLAGDTVLTSLSGLGDLEPVSILCSGKKI